MKSKNFKRAATATLAGLTLTFGSTSAVASTASCQAGAGCLLPLAPPAAPPAAPIEPAAAEATGGGIGALAILGGLAVAALIAVLLLSDDDDDTPTSA